LQAYAAHALAGSAHSGAPALKAALVRTEEPAQVERLLRDIFDLAGAAARESLAVAA
jgi:hypothetical protein